MLIIQAQLPVRFRRAKYDNLKAQSKGQGNRALRGCLGYEPEISSIVILQTPQTEENLLGQRIFFLKGVARAFFCKRVARSGLRTLQKLQITAFAGRRMCQML